MYKLDESKESSLKFVGLPHHQIKVRVAINRGTNCTVVIGEFLFSDLITNF